MVFSFFCILFFFLKNRTQKNRLKPNKNVCDENEIAFTTDLSADPDRIPVSNYDLCIILGNILDNAFTACMNNREEKNHIELTITISDNDMFYIHEQNSYNHAEDTALSGQPPEIPAFSDHGYGLQNIRKVTESHYGVFNIYFDDLFKADIVIPITDDKMRFLSHQGRKRHGT